MTFQELDIDSTIEELTLSEKILLLSGADFWHTYPVPRLNIPSVRVTDGPNGVRGTQFINGTPANCYPCGTALAATFDKDLLQQVGTLMAKDSKAIGAHCILGPTCNILRNPLGGRSFESYSEDPVLSGHVASQIIKGIESQDILACIKHFVCNDQEDERFKVDVLLSERALREIYLKPFQIALRDSNPRSLMTSYNKVNGEHVSQSKRIIQDILRKEWGYEGTVISDWTGVYSTKPSLDAGLNLEMPGPSKFRNVGAVSHAVNNNEIDIETINDNVKYILHFVNECMKSGVPENAQEKCNDSPEARSMLRKTGGESIVLLKNENNLLPLSKEANDNQKKIAVIGPNAKKCRYSGGGSASLNASYLVTPYDAIKDKLAEGNNSVSLEYTLGASIDQNLPDIGTIIVDENGETGLLGKFYDKPAGDKNRQLFDVKTYNTSTIFLFGYTNPKFTGGLMYVDFEFYYTPEISGEFDIGCTVAGTAQIFVDGKLVVDNKTNQSPGRGLLMGVGSKEERSTIHLEKGQKYFIKVEFGSGGTSKLKSEFGDTGAIGFGITAKLDHQEEIAKAVEIAKNVDKVILAIGISKDIESEGFDRDTMDIPGYTNDLVSAVAKVNKNVIVVNQSGSAVSMPWANEVQSIVQAWYGGNETGNTIADVLFGDLNPSGKLPMSFPVKLEHCPSHLHFGSMNGQVFYGEDIYVGYRYYEKSDRKVLFPFGYGLSYSKFELSHLKVETNDEAQTVNIKVTVKNIGGYAGSETVQAYVQQVNPSITRPNKELKDFAKVFLQPNESKIIEMSIPIKEATSYWNVAKNKWISEKDTYNVHVGNSSDNITLKDSFATKKTHYWIGL